MCGSDVKKSDEQGCLLADFVHPIIRQGAGNCWKFECPGDLKHLGHLPLPVLSLPVPGTRCSAEQSITEPTHLHDNKRLPELDAAHSGSFMYGDVRIFSCGTLGGTDGISQSG